MSLISRSLSDSNTARDTVVSAPRPSSVSFVLREGGWEGSRNESGSVPAVEAMRVMSSGLELEGMIYVADIAAWSEKLYARVSTRGI